MKKKLAIYGAGGLGREMLSMMKALPEWELSGFYDDGKNTGEHIGGVRVAGAMKELLTSNEETYVVIAIGNPKIKMQISEKLAANPHIHFPVLIHPHALIQDNATVKIGKGSIITAGVILTTDIVIGSHVLINLNCTVGHDVLIGDYCSVMPGANIAGEVKIGKATLIGSGANVLNGIALGDQSRVGAGAVVTRNVDEKNTVAGVPARRINSNS